MTLEILDCGAFQRSGIQNFLQSLWGYLPWHLKILHSGAFQSTEIQIFFNYSEDIQYDIESPSYWSISQLWNSKFSSTMVKIFTVTFKNPSFWSKFLKYISFYFENYHLFFIIWYFLKMLSILCHFFAYPHLPALPGCFRLCYGKVSWTPLGEQNRKE